LSENSSKRPPKLKLLPCNETYDECVHHSGAIMNSEYLFHAKAEWTTGRRGKVEGDPLAPKIDFAAPPEFQGVPGIWTPEHFFLAAVAGCFVTTFKAIADFSKFGFEQIEAAAEGVLEKTEGGYKFTRILLRPALTIEREQDRERAHRLLEKAERSCLISRSIQSEITLQPSVEVAQAVSQRSELDNGG
jgi:peroxiredoxin-like protein